MAKQTNSLAYTKWMSEVQKAIDDNDVDLYIECGRLKSLIQYYAFNDELENALDCHVEVVTTGSEVRIFLSDIRVTCVSTDWRTCQQIIG